MHVHTIHTEYIYIYREREREREALTLNWTKMVMAAHGERERERERERESYRTETQVLGSAAHRARESRWGGGGGGQFWDEGRSSKGTRPAHFEAHIFLDFFFFFFKKKIWHINLFSYYYFTFFSNRFNLYDLGSMVQLFWSPYLEDNFFFFSFPFLRYDMIQICNICPIIDTSFCTIRAFALC